MKKIWLITLLLLAACSQAPKPTLLQPVVRPETRVLEATTRTALQEVQPDGTLVFSGLQAFQTGNVLVSEPTSKAPDGLLRKVTQVEQSGGQTIVHTAQAQIGDALQRGSLRAEKALNEADLQTVVPGPNVKLGNITAQADGFTIPFNLVVLDKDSNPSTTNDRITASGELQIKPVFKIDLDLDCGFLCLYDNDLDFLAQIGVQESAKIKIQGDNLLGYTLKSKHTITILNFGTQTFFVGPVPVVVRPRIVLELQFDGKVGIKVSYEAGQTLKAVAGAKYVDHWENISNLDNSFSAGPVEAQSEVSGILDAKAKAALRAELMLYGVIGPTIEIAPFVRLDLMFPRDPFWKLDAGIEGNVGIMIDILGYSKSYSTNLWDNSIEIARSPNSAPNIKFLSSAGNVDANLCCTLRVQVSDAEDGPSCCLASFKSSNNADGVNGALGNGSGIQPQVEYSFKTLGSRTITATAVDSKGKTSNTTLEINVVNTPPTLAINTPFSGQQFFQGLNYTLHGSSYDINETNFGLPCTSLVWKTNVAADGQKTGCDPQINFGSSGSRTLTLTGTDGFGATGTASVNITVLPPPANYPPVVNISSPQNGITIGPDTVLKLVGTASDPELGAVTLAWDVTRGYNPLTGIGSQTLSITPAANGDWKPSDSISYNSGGGCEVNDTLRVRLKAKDPQNNEGFDFVVIKVLRIC